MYAAQWNTHVTPSNACSIADASQMSPTMLVIFIFSGWSVKYCGKLIKNMQKK